MKLKKLISALTAFVLVCGVPVFQYEKPLIEMRAGAEDFTSEVYENLFEYCKYSDHIEIGYAIDPKKLEVLEIPSEIDGLPVTVIRMYSFSGCTALTSVTIPDGVTDIEMNAFYGCGKLTSITIPDSVVNIGEMTFSHCEALTSVTLPENISIIKENLFEYCKNLYFITIPDNVTYIERYAFVECTNLTSVTIPDSVKTISSRAFAGCKSLNSITIPDSVKTIGSSAFYNCENLTSVEISDSVVNMEHFVFSGCKNLKSLTIPESVSIIESSAFYGCTRLNYVTIPKSVASIGSQAFYNCTNLTDIYYSGTEEEWNNIYISEDNADLLNAEIHFDFNENNQNLSGDANLDGKISISDAVAVLQYLANAEKYPLDGQSKINADVDGTDGVTGKDAAVIQQYDAGIVTELPIKFMN